MKCMRVCDDTAAGDPHCQWHVCEGINRISSCFIFSFNLIPFEKRAGSASASTASGILFVLLAASGLLGYGLYGSSFGCSIGGAVAKDIWHM
eukprot:1192285-Amphidinium_carterae.2